MTTTYDSAIDNLADVRQGHARFDQNGFIEIGSHSDGTDAVLTLTGEHRTFHTWITGATGSGKTELLRSLYAGAAAAGIGVTMTSALETTNALEEAYRRDDEMALRGLRKGECDAPMRLLLVDAPGLTGQEAAELAALTKLGAWTNIAVVLATPDATLASLGSAGSDSALLQQNLAGGNFVSLRSVENGIPRQFTDGTHTAGVGYLNDEPFRAWWAGQ